MAILEFIGKLIPKLHVTQSENLDVRLPRIPGKGRSRTWLASHRLKIDKLVVLSCNGSEINRRDGLTRAWNHFRVPFCPNGNRSNQDQNRVPIHEDPFEAWDRSRTKALPVSSLPFLFPTNTFGTRILAQIIIRLNND